MHAGRESRRRHRRETFRHQRRRDAREALGIRAESRELEGGDSGLCLLGNLRGSLGRVDGAVKREIDPRLLSRVGDLALDRRRRADEVSFVIGHVDDRRDAARGRRARGPDEVLLISLR